MKGASVRTTMAIDERLLEEARELSGAKTKKEAVEIALHEFITRRKVRKLIDLEGKVDLSFSLEELQSRRRRDVPHR